MSQKSLERSPLDAPPTTWLVDSAALVNLKFDKEKNINTNYGHFGEKSETFNKIEKSDNIRSIWGERIYAISPKYLTKQVVTHPLRAFYDLGSFSYTPKIYDVHPYKFRSEYVLSCVLNVNGNDGNGSIDQLKYEHLIDNSLIFGKIQNIGKRFEDLVSKEKYDEIKINGVMDRLPLTIKDVDYFNVNDKMVDDDFIFSKFETIGELFKGNYKDDEFHKYCVMTFRGYFLNKMGIDESVEEAAHSGFSNEESTRSITNQFNKLYSNLKFNPRLNPDIHENGETGFKNDVYGAYEQMYDSINFTRENLVLMTKLNIEIPIKFIIARQGHYLTTTVFKVRENGETLSVGYSDLHTIITDTTNKHGIRYNYRCGYEFNNPKSCQKFKNFSIIDIQGVNTEFFDVESQLKTGKKVNLDSLEQGLRKSCMVIPVIHNFEIEKLPSPFDITGTFLTNTNIDKKKYTYDYRNVINKFWKIPENKTNVNNIYTSRYMANFDSYTKEMKTFSPYYFRETCYYKREGKMVKAIGSSPFLGDFIYPGCVPVLKNIKKDDNNNSLKNCESANFIGSF